MLDNCFRFAPRDSIPGLIAKICKYLKDHPGWSEKELEDQIKKFISATGVESFNGRTGTVTLDKNDVNNLKIASAYFAEGNESIDRLDIVSLYNQGVRFVFTDFNSVTSGYNLAFVLDYLSGSGDVVYYPMSTGSGGSGNIVSVNGKTGVVELSLADIIGTSGVQVKLCTETEFASANMATWNSYYNEGYRIIGVVNSNSTAIDYIYLLKQDGNNHTPIGLSTGASDAYTPKNPPPYPVTSVNGKTGVVTGLYDENNQPPYPVTSVNGSTGAVEIARLVSNDYSSYIEPQSASGFIRNCSSWTTLDGKRYGWIFYSSPTNMNTFHSSLYDEESNKWHDSTVYTTANPPPYPVTKVDGNTGEVNTFSFIEGSSFPKSITKSGGITCFSYPLQGSSLLPKGNTAVYQVNFNGGVPIPVSASYIGNGYGVQCSVCRNTNTSFLVSITNHNDFGEIDLTGSYICITFYPNGATSITGVTNG